MKRSPRSNLRIGVKGTLLQSLRSTNAIESLNDKIASYTSWVKRWQGGKMILRWVGAAFVYVAFIVDVFSRKIVGWRVSSSSRELLDFWGERSRRWLPSPVVTVYNG